MQMIFGMITSCIRGFRVLRGTWFGVSATAPRDYIESAIVTRNGSLGSGPADVVPVRLDPDLRAALSGLTFTSCQIRCGGESLVASGIPRVRQALWRSAFDER